MPTYIECLTMYVEGVQSEALMLPGHLKNTMHQHTVDMCLILMQTMM
jgi:hypothetical protein